MKNTLLEILDRYSQKQILPFTKSLSATQRSALEKQAEEIRPHQTPHQPHLTTQTYHQTESLIQTQAIQTSNASDQLLRQGRVATLVLAGGAGSRLRILQPKGCYPISPIRHKSLFQLVIERAIAAQKLYETELRVAFLVAHDAQTVVLDFFRRHAFFGFPPEQIDILPQPYLPYYDRNNEWFFSEEGKIAVGSNGNGAFLETLETAGYFDFLQEKGIDHLSVIPIDNPLADPFSAAMTHAHTEAGCDVSLLCFERKASDPKVGILVEKEGKIGIVDYTQVKGSMPGFANCNIFLFTLSFLRRAAKEIELPIHWVEKKTVRYDPLTHKEQRVLAYKGEKFITDLIEHADRVAPLLATKKEVFSPLKNLDGTNGVADVQNHIYQYNRGILNKLTGSPITANVELAMDFYYPTKELRERWRGKKLPTTEYIRADS